jgi:sugar O-acyltransferase (sialic acid O-acetyltransferase NeuD family)
MLVAIFAKKVNKVRAEKYHEAKAKGYQLINYISSRATTWPGLVLGDNCLIFENCICQPFSEIGSSVIIRSGCVIGHHSVIKDHCFLGACAVVLGCVVVEPYCFIGANATIRNGITIAKECVIGAGALILKDTKEKGIYKGIPPELLPITSDKLRKI